MAQDLDRDFDSIMFGTAWPAAFSSRRQGIN
jgi:hypothetical protein